MAHTADLMYSVLLQNRRAMKRPEQGQHALRILTDPDLGSRHRNQVCCRSASTTDAHFCGHVTCPLFGSNEAFHTTSPTLPILTVVVGQECAVIAYPANTDCHAFNSLIRWSSALRPSIVSVGCEVCGPSKLSTVIGSERSKSRCTVRSSGFYSMTLSFLLRCCVAGGATCTGRKENLS